MKPINLLVHLQDQRLQHPEPFHQVVSTAVPLPISLPGLQPVSRLELLQNPRSTQRKFGLHRDARAQVIRATGGSSRFVDIERILRASDFEEPKDDRRRPPAKQPRREAFVVQEEEDSSLELPLSSESDDADVFAQEAQDQTPEESAEEEMQEILEIQKKAKREFKKNFRTYKDSKKKVREIKKNRQPYLPVVALQPEGAQASGSTQHPVGQTKASGYKPDKKFMQKGKVKVPYPRKEEAHLATGHEVIEFNYMIEPTPTRLSKTELDILLASIPNGYAILDTGATTSVIGADTAMRYGAYFQQQGFPAPVEITMPPVELRGFSGQVEKTSRGLKWIVKLGGLHGAISTYVVPGQTPFLLSRRVLENMEAVIDMGKLTITSAKHQMDNEPLGRSSNGHLLISICPGPQEFEVQQCEKDEPNTDDQDAIPPSTSTSLEVHCPSRSQHEQEDGQVKTPHAASSNQLHRNKVTESDRRRAFSDYCEEHS